MISSPESGKIPSYPARTRVIRAVKDWMNEGRLIRGELLPTEQALCRELQVSRGTVRAALQQLESEGVLEAREGNGRLRGRVVSGAPAAGVDFMADTIVVATHVLDIDRADGNAGTLEAIDTSIAAATREAGKHLLVLHRDALNKQGIVRLLASSPLGVAVGGAVADYAANREMLLKLVGRVPMVVNSGDEMWTTCDRVFSDQAAGAYDLTRWALQQGRRRMLCVWSKPPTHYWVRERNLGHQRALAEAEIETLPPLYLPRRWQAGDSTADKFQARVREFAGYLVDWLVPTPRIDCLLVASDQEAYVAAAACRLCAVHVHQQIMVLGYDNMLSCKESEHEPVGPAATVDKQNALVGRHMVDLLMRRVRQELPPQAQEVRLPPILVPRLNISPIQNAIPSAQ